MAGTALVHELGRELRRGRLAAGFATQVALAGELQVDRSVISRAENGSRVPTDAVIKAWCGACKLDHARIDSVVRAARGSVPDWFEGWRDVEGRSRRLAYWSPLIIAPVCRTERYVRAVLGASGAVVDDRQVAAQLARASVLTRAEVTIVIHELAIRRFVGSAHVMAEELRHLAHAAELPSVHVGLVPNDRTAPGMSGALNLAADLGVAHMDGLRGRTVSDPDMFRDAAILFERIRAHALPCDLSRTLILEEAQRWTLQTQQAQAGGNPPTLTTAEIAQR